MQGIEIRLSEREDGNPAYREFTVQWRFSLKRETRSQYSLQPWA